MLACSITHTINQSFHIPRKEGPYQMDNASAEKRTITPDGPDESSVTVSQSSVTRQKQDFHGLSEAKNE